MRVTLAVLAMLAAGFGSSVALSRTGQTIVVGAHTRDDGGTDNGAIYVIEWTVRRE